MKIFGFEIRKFKDEPETIQARETWVVEWYSLHWYAFFERGESKKMFLTFTTKDLANSYAKELTDARKLLGDDIPEPKVYKQKAPSNV